MRLITKAWRRLVNKGGRDLNQDYEEIEKYWSRSSIFQSSWKRFINSLLQLPISIMVIHYKFPECAESESLKKGQNDLMEAHQIAIKSKRGNIFVINLHPFYSGPENEVSHPLLLKKIFSSWCFGWFHETSSINFQKKPNHSQKGLQHDTRKSKLLRLFLRWHKVVLSMIILHTKNWMEKRVFGSKHFFSPWVRNISPFSLPAKSRRSFAL